MSYQQPLLAVNGRLITLAAGGVITQSFEDFGGFSTLRFASGVGLAQESWRKVRTTISASGWVPAGLDDIDWSAPVTIGCVKTRSIKSASNVITIASARRTDAPPYGFSIGPRGNLRAAAVTMAGNVATIAPTADATGYVVLWYPEMTVLATSGVTCEWDVQGAVESWAISGEEV